MKNKKVDMMSDDYSSGFGDGYREDCRPADEKVNVAIKWKGKTMIEFHGVSHSDVEKAKKSGGDCEFVVDSQN